MKSKSDLISKQWECLCSRKIKLSLYYFYFGLKPLIQPRKKADSYISPYLQDLRTNLYAPYTNTEHTLYVRTLARNIYVVQTDMDLTHKV